jgi:SPP1 gp7 family putative phage head morphogenesis protein
MLLSDVMTRQSAKMPMFYNLIRNLLILRGRTWKKNDWSLKWAQVNLRDILKQAQARFMNAQADMYDTTTTAKATKQIHDTGYTIHDKRQNVIHTASCIMDHASSKELNRPTPWPELDKVEEDYLKELQYEWGELKGKVFLILKLQSAKRMAQGVTEEDAKRNAPGAMHSAEKQDLPGLEAFNFSPEQRAMIMQSLKDWLGTFNITDENSPVLWYYGQAYSLGLIQAVNLIGKERPILDIIKNQEVFDELCKNGFQLVKDDATQAIVNEILPAIDAHVIAGSNPLQIASVLEKIFGDKNSDWERLARTEMSAAAEQAKLDEWNEWGVKKVQFVPAPDACPFCFSIAGEYPVGQCPVPGTDTHPRCRCSIIPVDSGT